MGVLQRFERRVEKLVNGAFARAFRAEVQPVEIASALQRTCDERAAIVSRGRTMVPNTFTVELGPTDAERLSDYRATLAEELAGMVRDHAEEQHYSFIGPVSVQITEAEDLETGMFRVAGSAVAGVTSTGRSQQPPPHSPQPYSSQPHSSQPYRPQPHSPPAHTPEPAPGVSRSAPSAVPVRPDPEATQQVSRPTAPGRRFSGRLEVGATRLEITNPVTVLGRGTDVDLRIDDPGVSRRHAEVRLHGDEAIVVDLGSTNGVVLDGQRVGEARLEDGATIRLGSTEIRFRRGPG